MAEPFVPDVNTELLSRSIDDYPGGIIIPIDKPYRWTSADVIRKVKFAAIRHFGKKNLKVGHAGTLDPLATGVLLVCIGNATKLADDLQRHDKAYVAGVTFGATTPSYDLEKDIDQRYPYEHIDEASVRDALVGFIGEQDQVAPLFSAKSVDGVRAYEIARKAFKAGEPIPDDVLRASRITISECELLTFEKSLSAVASSEAEVSGDCATLGIIRGRGPLGGGSQSEMSHETSASGEAVSKASSRINVAEDDLSLPHASIHLACTKGTYVRAFARDLGETLGSGAFLNSLQRSRSGVFCVEKSLTVDQALELLAR
ncbi:MAG: hypothetical protein MJY72_03855 [Bacteroidales bacterium]|nr:hypothetical protein [Bacteroidales bacterium]